MTRKLSSDISNSNQKQICVRGEQTIVSRARAVIQKHSCSFQWGAVNQETRLVRTRSAHISRLTQTWPTRAITQDSHSENSRLRLLHGLTLIICTIINQYIP